MKTFLSLVTGLVCLATASSAEFQPLFNGKDLSGWHIMNDVTTEVRDGNLRIVKGMGWLRSDKEYRDFVFECEWRALDGRKAWEFDKFTPEKGYVGIQVENRAFDFRNLRLRELR